MFLIDQLSGLASPDSHNYKRYFYLLEVSHSAELMPFPLGLWSTEAGSTRSTYCTPWNYGHRGR